MAETEKINSLLSELDALDESKRNYFTKHTVMVPTREEVVGIIEKIQKLMFPDYFTLCDGKESCRAKICEDLFLELKRQITASCSFYGEHSVVNTEELAYELMSEIPKIKEKQFDTIDEETNLFESRYKEEVE